MTFRRCGFRSTVIMILGLSLVPACGWVASLLLPPRSSEHDGLYSAVLSGKHVNVIVCESLASDVIQIWPVASPDDESQHAQTHLPSHIANLLADCDDLAHHVASIPPGGHLYIVQQGLPLRATACIGVRDKGGGSIALTGGFVLSDLTNGSEDYSLLYTDDILPYMPISSGWLVNAVSISVTVFGCWTLWRWMSVLVYRSLSKLVVAIALSSGCFGILFVAAMTYVLVHITNDAMMASSSQNMFASREVGGRTWELTRQERWGVMRLISTWSGEAAFVGFGKSPDNLSPEELAGRFAGPLRKYKNDKTVITSFGWPCLAIWKYDIETPGDTGLEGITEHGDPTRTSRSGLIGTHLLWAGLLLNVATSALAIAFCLGLSVLPTVLKVLYRLRNLRCAHCGYDCRFAKRDKCSECGQPIAKYKGS